MNSKQLECMINCDFNLRMYVLGVFSIDTLPLHVISRPFALIFNSDVSTSVGTHWLAIYVDSTGYGEFFDSYGHSPHFYGLAVVNFLQRHCYHHKHNVKRLQDNNTMVCGEYCLYYLMFKCRGYSMNSFLSQFCNNYLMNDVFVYQCIRQTFPYCI